MPRTAAPMRAPQPARPNGSTDSDGPNLVLLLFALAVVIGLLVGLGARSLTREYARHPQAPHGGHSLPVEAVELGYHTEHDFASDGKLAAVALAEVLEAGPGAQRLWENVETGNRGVVWASGASQRPGGAVCRALARRTLINNKFQNAGAEACSTADGHWDATVRWTNE